MVVLGIGILVFSLILTIENKFECLEWKKIIGIGIAILLGSFLTYKGLNSKYEYKEVVLEGMTYNELSEKYEILDTDGLVITIKDKN